MILLSVVSKEISLVPKNDPAVVKLCEPVIAAFLPSGMVKIANLA